MEATMVGGLIVAPSGPGLAYDLPRNPHYAQAMTEANVVLPDSGFMVLLWNMLHFFSPAQRMERLSGLRFLRALLVKTEVQAPGASFWVMPTPEDRERNLGWLRDNGFSHLTEEDCYLAPRYRAAGEDPVTNPIEDPELLEVLERHRAHFIVLNIAGGIQEQLGLWLKRNLSYRPAIICTGAAIAFITGGQAHIPPWADRLYLGWLLRIISDPRVYTKRYVQALAMVPLVLKWTFQGKELIKVKGEVEPRVETVS
jgi:UDP-N-acetyl-D-mannosaminuronic acid transferase (WecB/TagA/CpsF family)